MTKRDEIIKAVANGMSYEQMNDLPMIREGINNMIDYFIRDGTLTEARANTYSQDKMVKEVQRILKTFPKRYTGEAEESWEDW